MEIALVENLGSDFYNARVRLALYLQNLGCSVTAIVPDDGYVEKIRSLNVKVISVSDNIRGSGILNKIVYAIDLIKIFRSHQFDIVHTFRLQPNIIATFVVGYYTNTKIVNHITGLGMAFNYNTYKYKVMQSITRLLYRINYRLFGPVSVFQNYYDMRDLGCPKGSFCVKGSSVNEDRFNHSSVSTRKLDQIKRKYDISQDESIKFLFVSRLLKEKGIGELVKGFKLASQGKKIQLLIVGWFDENNDSSFTRDDLTHLIGGCNKIKFLGRQNDIPEIISISDVGILPTYYREGTPRFLLESMAMRKPIITTKMPGCDQLIDNKRNGILIMPKSVDAIEKSIKTICERDLREMGEKSYEIYKKEFAEKVVYESLVDIYKMVINEK
ncbi:glycosyltransferase [bacterium]|nr:glycosyltransferase [bacterium]